MKAPPHADCTFTTLPGAVSSERGYELVTPANRQGGSDLFGEAEVNNNAANTERRCAGGRGEGFLLETKAAFGEFPFAVGQIYTFTRELERGSWSDTSLASRSLATQRPEGTPLTTPDSRSSRSMTEWAPLSAKKECS